MPIILQNGYFLKEDTLNVHKYSLNIRTLQQVEKIKQFHTPVIMLGRTGRGRTGHSDTVIGWHS